MIVEMGCLILGVPVGFLLRRKPLVIKITDQVLTWSVRILLLLLGLALGADDRLMSQMDTIGARGIFISLCCVAREKREWTCRSARKYFMPSD